MRFYAMVILLVVAVPGLANDKTSPDFLRQKHAGTVGFESTDAVAALYPELFAAAQRCWVGQIKPGAGTGYAGGALGTISSASRVVVGEISPDDSSAYIAVRAKGFFGAVQDNFLQIDLISRGDKTHLDVYYKNNVKGQRQFVGQVDRWLKGGLDYCDPDPFFKHPR
jgi:hypothetical protein